MWPRPPTPMTTACEPGVSLGSDSLTAWYGVRPASVSGAAATRSSSSGTRTRWRGSGTSMYVRHAPVQPDPAADGAVVGMERVRAVVVGPFGAGFAAATAPRSMQGDPVTDLPAGDPLAHLVDRPGVLVADRHGRSPREQAGAVVVHDVQVGVAGARRRHLDHDLAGSGQRHRGVVDDDGVGLPAQESKGTHGGPRRVRGWAARLCPPRLGPVKTSGRSRLYAVSRKSAGPETKVRPGPAQEAFATSPRASEAAASRNRTGPSPR